MKNRVMFIIAFVILISLIPKMESKVTYDEDNMIEVLKTIYTTSYDQFDDRFHIVKTRHEELKNYFTDEALKSPWLTIFPISYSDRFYALKCNTKFNSVEFKKENRLIYSYKVVLDLEYIDGDIASNQMYITGEVTLKKENDEYKIHFMHTTGSNFEELSRKSEKK